MSGAATCQKLLRQRKNGYAMTGGGDSTYANEGGDEHERD